MICPYLLLWSLFTLLHLLFWTALACLEALKRNHIAFIDHLGCWLFVSLVVWICVLCGSAFSRLPFPLLRCCPLSLCLVAGSYFLRLGSGVAWKFLVLGFLLSVYFWYRDMVVSFWSLFSCCSMDLLFLLFCLVLNVLLRLLIHHVIIRLLIGLQCSSMCFFLWVD